MPPTAYCIHFRGIQHKTCEAGVELLSVRDASQPGPYRWPCLTIDHKAATTTCASFRAPTPEEHEQRERETTQLLERFFERQRAGLCTECGVKITNVRQHGRCVYAAPCGHRIGQGNATQVRKALKL